VAHACFGNSLSLERYEKIAHDKGVGLVVDAAASLGSLDEHGHGFGTDFPHALVFSMHVTKTFATSEGGVIYRGDAERLARLRAMGNFGFCRSNEATLPGLNSKISEIGALLALAKLETSEEIVGRRAALAADYRRQLPSFSFRRTTGWRQAHQFMPALLPNDCPVSRAAVIAALNEEGISAGHYFSPHLAEQPYFAATCVIGDLDVTQRIAARALSLPMSDLMNGTEVMVVCEALRPDELGGMGFMNETNVSRAYRDSRLGSAKGNSSMLQTLGALCFQHAPARRVLNPWTTCTFFELTALCRRFYNDPKNVRLHFGAEYLRFLNYFQGRGRISAKISCTYAAGALADDLRKRWAIERAIAESW
jgi:hypothetical protein